MAEDHIPPAVELTKLIASYPSLDGANPSSWFVWSDDTGIPPKSTQTSVCHANMRFQGAGFDHLVTACPKSNDLSLRYVRMLIHGPFKAFSDTISLKKHKNDHYIQVDHLEKWPANVLFNFCIATRVPIEYPQLFELWDELTKLGYPELFAFLLSYTTDGVPFKIWRDFPNRNHFWFDPAADWTKILAGHPDLSCKDFKGHPTHILPTNKIWGKSDVHYKLSDMTDAKVAEFFDIKLAVKPQVRRSLQPEIKLKKYGYADVPPNWNAEPAAHADLEQLAANPLGQVWANAIAAQDAAAVQVINNVFEPNVIQLPQPPPPVDWDFDEDNHDDDDGLDYPEFPDDLIDE